MHERPEVGLNGSRVRLVRILTLHPSPFLLLTPAHLIELGRETVKKHAPIGGH